MLHVYKQINTGENRTVRYTPPPRCQADRHSFIVSFLCKFFDIAGKVVCFILGIQLILFLIAIITP